MVTVETSDEGEIQDLLVRYATGIDRRDWELFRSCWIDDIEADYGEFGQFTDAESLVVAMRNAHDKLGPTYHFMSNIVVDVDGTVASSRTYVHAMLCTEPGCGSWVEAVGHYDDVFHYTPHGWRIARRTVRIARRIDNRSGRGV